MVFAEKRACWPDMARAGGGGEGPGDLDSLGRDLDFLKFSTKRLGKKAPMRYTFANDTALDPGLPAWDPGATHLGKEGS